MSWNDGIYDGVGQDVAAMVEAHNAAVWEELNEEQKLDYKMVCYDLTDAYDCLKDAIYEIDSAAKEADGFHWKSRIKSLIDDIEYIQDDITSLIARMKEEEVKGA